jgi:hypothetical protein
MLGVPLLYQIAEGSLMVLAQLDKLTEQPWIIIAGVVAVIAVIVLLRTLLGAGKKPHDPVGGLRENLADYPPAPGVPGSRRLRIHGVPVRLRLVVVAPTGKQQEDITPDEVSELLDDVHRGLANFLRSDKPRVKVWPPQLSVAGFAPTFHRLVACPDPQGKPSRWVRAAGPVKAGGRPILLGLALYADEPVKLGLIVFEAHEWADALRIER